MPPLVTIVGETASGKSSLALLLAERFNGEILCADSWTVYEGFDIGTAKPSAEEQARVPHHLLDVADPVSGFNAPEFQKLAKEAITDIAGRDRLPILVGGTGLYIDSVLYNYGFLEQSDPAMRAILNDTDLADLLAQARTRGLDTSSIDSQNKRRVIRLIENNGAVPTKSALRENTLVIGLATNREYLRERVEQRVDAMLASGLESEIQQLSKRYGWGVEPMKGIGYREWQSYFLGTQSLPETRARIVKSTMDLAKRQRTWFKRNESIHWLNNPSTAVDIVTTFLNKIR